MEWTARSGASCTAPTAGTPLQCGYKHHYLSQHGHSITQMEMLAGITIFQPYIGSRLQQFSAFSDTLSSDL